MALLSAAPSLFQRRSLNASSPIATLTLRAAVFSVRLILIPYPSLLLLTLDPVDLYRVYDQATITHQYPEGNLTHYPPYTGGGILEAYLFGESTHGRPRMVLGFLGNEIQPHIPVAHLPVYLSVPWPAFLWDGQLGPKHGASLSIQCLYDNLT